MQNTKCQMASAKCQVLTALFAFPRETRERCQLLQVFGERTRRSAPEDDTPPADYLIRQHAAARSENDARLDRCVVSDANLSSHDRTVSDLDTARNAGLGCDHDIGSDGNVMPDVYQIVELGSRADHGFVQRTAVNGAVGADLDVLANDKFADLGKFVITAVLFIAHESEAVRAQHSACMHHHTAAQRRTRIDDDAWIQVTIVTDHDALADEAAGSNVRALSHYSIGFDHRVGFNGCAAGDFRRSMDDCRGMNAGSVGPGWMEQLTGPRESQPGMGCDQQGLASGGRGRELSSDDRVGRRSQRLCQVLLVLHKYQSARLRLRDAGDVRDLEVAVADQAGGSEFRQRLQSLVHDVVIAAASEQWIVDRKIEHPSPYKTRTARDQACQRIPPRSASALGGLDIRRQTQRYAVADLVQSQYPGMVRIWRLPFGLDI